jgi:hypothetical protein
MGLRLKKKQGKKGKNGLDLGWNAKLVCFAGNAHAHDNYKDG